MRRLTLALDSLPALREIQDGARSELTGAATIAELAGVAALRLGIREELRPVRQADVLELRAAARRLELRIPASQSVLKVALEARPDLVVLAAETWDGGIAASGVDPRGKAAVLSPLLRTLEDAGIAVSLRIGADLDAVKAAHGLGARGVEFFTRTIVDLPPIERQAELQALGDAVRLASKLRMAVAVAGGLDFDVTPEVLEAAPAATRIVSGSALVSRALLVGLDRAIRDYRALFS